MRSKNLFIKRNPTLPRRLLNWGIPLLLVVPILPKLYSPKIDSGPIIWPPPIELPGSVVVTENTAQSRTTKPFEGYTPEVISDTEKKTTTQYKQPLVENALPVNENATLSETLYQWIHAWSTKNVDNYLSFYGDDFIPPKGLNRKTWEASRNERISSKEKINIDIQNLRFQIRDDLATVEFIQVYRDERLRMTDRKTMAWKKLNGRWLIQLETTK